MAKKKPVSGNTVSGMSVADAVEKATKQLHEQLESARTVGANTMRELDKVRAELAQHKPLLVDAANALSYALAHPDFSAGGKHHAGALGTAFPILRALNAAVGNTGGSSSVLPGAEAAASPADASPDAAG